MTQDLQTQSAPAPENLPDATASPVGDTPVDEVEETPADSKPNPATVTASVAAGRAQALEIAELCQLAGQTTRIASFLAQGISASQVRQALLLSRAQSEEISSLIHPDAAKPVAKTANDGASALLAAVKKLSGTP